MRLPSQCIHFEESIIFLEGAMNSDFAHTSIIYHEHLDSLSFINLLALLSIIQEICDMSLPEAFGHVVL